MAASTTLQLLTAIAPQVAARADYAVFLEIAATQMYATAWGDVYAIAACYLAAHLATLSPSTAAAAEASASVAGPLTQESAGDLSRSYGSATSGVSGIAVSDASLMSTAYGREFIRLRNTRSASAPRVIRI